MVYVLRLLRGGGVSARVMTGVTMAVLAFLLLVMALHTAPEGTEKLKN